MTKPTNLPTAVLAQMLQWSEGNPGAFMFLAGLFDDTNAYYCLPIAMKLQEQLSLRGTNLYVLFNDLCNRDYSLVCKLCMNCPDSILIDACSRQDYSGIDLVKPYLMDHNYMEDKSND